MVWYVIIEQLRKHWHSWYLYFNFHFFFIQVSGDANFSIQWTGMTLGGLIQPSVDRALIEQQSNVEKDYAKDFYG